MADISRLEDEARRDFLVVAGNAFAAVGAASLLWPFVKQMSPDSSALAMASTEVDLAPIKEGAAITIMWRGKPVFIRHRTQAEIDSARSVELSSLVDQVARNTALPAEQPASDINRVLAGHEKWLILVGVCTTWAVSPRASSLPMRAAITAAGFVSVMARITTHRDEFGKVQLPEP